jgi:metalloendopeptidase OMA1, mitochondrial
LWIFAFLFCFYLPEIESAFFVTSASQEAQMGREAFNELKQTTPISGDPAANAQVQRVVRRLAPHVSSPGASGWEIVVFQDSKANAFALPGGKIGVHTGILPVAGSDAGLAVVLGHEMAHVAQRHAGQRFGQQFGVMLGYSALGLALKNEDYKTRQLWGTAAGVGSQVFLTLPFSRSHELEADRLGLITMAKAGYDPREAIGFWQRMQSGGRGTPEFLSTHPSGGSRIQQIQKLLPTALAYYRPSGQRQDSRANLVAPERDAEPVGAPPESNDLEGDLGN